MMKQNTLWYTDCLGLTSPERNYYVDKASINPATGKAYAINPSTGVWDDNYWSKVVEPSLNKSSSSSSPVSSSPSSSSSSSSNLVDTASNILNFQKQANAPVVTALQNQSTSLSDSYKSLLDSIKGNQTTATNQQTLTTANELGKRGISSDSGYYQQEMTNAINPILAGYSGLTAQTGLQENQQLSDLAVKIAQAQAGDPNAAYSAAIQLQQLDQQQKALDAQISQNTVQNSLGSATLANQTKQINYDVGKPYYNPADTLNLSSLISLLEGAQNPSSTANGGGWSW